MAQVMTVKQVVSRGCDAQKKFATVLRTPLSQSTLRENVFLGFKHKVAADCWSFFISVVSLMELEH